MKGYSRHITAGSLAVLMLSAVLLLLYFDHSSLPTPPEQLALREVKVFSPPPPPPPPPVTREDSSKSGPPDLSSSSIRPTPQLDTMGLNVSLEPGELVGSSGFDGEIGIDWGNVDLSDLDDYPQPLNNPVYVFSRQAIRAGIDVIDVRLHIAIDEAGNAYLVNILSSTYPEERSKLSDFVSRMKFTPPTLLGVPVRTEFIWPVHFERR